MNNWQRVSNFVPALWLAPRIQDSAACELAKGRFVIGSITGYESKPDEKYGTTNHFYQFCVTESSEKEAHIYNPDDKEGDGYTTVPATFPGVYSVRASGLLHSQLQKFWNDQENHFGRPLRITYAGAKDFKTDKPGSPGTMITVKSHQWTVDMDADFTPLLAAPEAQAQIEHKAPEEPLPILDDEKA